MYGSDAIAGVVNFVMRKDFEGVELDSTVGAYQHNNSNSSLRALQSSEGFANAPSSMFDGETFTSTLILGTNSADDKGNITAYLSYQNIRQVLQKTRDYSACSIGNLSSTGKGPGHTVDSYVCGGSFNYSAYHSLTGPKAGYYYFMEPGGHLTYFTGTPNMYFNYGAYNSIQRPDTRFSGGTFAHYEVNKALDVYASFMFMDDSSSWQAAPTAAFYLASNNSKGQLNINCDNPLLTGQFISMFCPNGTVVDPGTGKPGLAQVDIARRNVEGGPRITEYRHTSYRMVVGAKGDLGDGWAYDASAQESYSLYSQLYLGDWSKTAVQNALLVNPNGTCQNGDFGVRTARSLPWHRCSYTGDAKIRRYPRPG